MAVQHRVVGSASAPGIWRSSPSRNGDRAAAGNAAERKRGPGGVGRRSPEVDHRRPAVGEDVAQRPGVTGDQQAQRGGDLRGELGAGLGRDNRRSAASMCPEESNSARYRLPPVCGSAARAGHVRRRVGRGVAARPACWPSRRGRRPGCRDQHRALVQAWASGPGGNWPGCSDSSIANTAISAEDDHRPGDHRGKCFSTLHGVVQPRALRLS